MTIRIAINGFGRIGRSVLRALYESGRRAEISVVAINELANAEGMAHLLKYDSSHGRFAWDVRQECDTLSVGDDAIRLLHQPAMEQLPWGELGVDVVLDCSGVYGSRADGEAHLAAGAKKVLFAHPGGNDLDATIVFGVNHQTLLAEHRIVSNASCTTNCIIPVIAAGRRLQHRIRHRDHHSLGDERSAGDRRVSRGFAAHPRGEPVDHSGRHQAGRGHHPYLPAVLRSLRGDPVRVPTINVTAIDLSVSVSAAVKVAEVNQLLQKAARESFRGIVDYTELPLVSIDFNHDPHSAIVDGTQTRVSGQHLIKTLVWCDNEWGFANRMLDTTRAMAASGF